MKEWSKYLKGKGKKRKVFCATISTVYSPELQITILDVIVLIASSEESIL